MTGELRRREASRTRSGTWRFEALLGRSELTEVWRGRAVDGAPVAIKRARAQRRHDRGVAALLRAEHAWLGALDHPNVLTALCLLDHDASPILVSEYCPGGNLVPLLGARPRHWARLLYDVAATLKYLHAHGVVHRDLKPRNVLLRAGDAPVLGDFGLAARLGQHVRWGGGTAEYRPPGVAASGVAEPGLDWYAFAVVLHELLTGRLPGRNRALQHELELEAGADAAARAAWHRLTGWMRQALAISPSALGTLSPPGDVLESMLTLSEA